ncbi:hypothetical protein [Streptomyces sp. NPDC046978]|uniref:hypothetical protein n=1 Tax=Streptomyces sp. NPDC046978 TaxID=3154704 RepID=UPI0034072492
MTRRTRILSLAYPLHCMWSAWCAAQQYLYGNVPVAVLFILFAFVPIAAMVEQNEAATLRGALQVYEAQDGHRCSREALEAAERTPGSAA